MPRPGKLRRLGWEPYEGRRTLRAFVGLIGSSVGLLWRASRLGLVSSVGLFVLGALAQVSTLLALQSLLETAAEQQRDDGDMLAGSAPGLILLGLALAVLATAQLAAAAIRPMLIERATFYVFERVLDAASAAELRSFDTSDFHDRLSRAQNAGGRPLVITQGLLGVLGSTTSLVGLTVVLVTLQPLLVVPVVLLLLPMILVQRATSRRYYRFATEFNEAERHRYYLRGLLIGRASVPEVRSYGIEGYIRRRNSELFDERVSRLAGLTRQAVVRSLAGGLMAALAIVSSLAVLIAMVSAGRLSLASTAVGAVAIVQVAGVLSALAVGIGQLYESALFVDDYRTFSAAVPEPSSRARLPLPERLDRIEVRRVSFTYPGSAVPAVRSVDMTIRRGQVVALVGENGSGKTTLAKLICALYRPESGTIAWDGVDLDRYDPEQVRRSISVVFQDFGRYLFTVEENIGIGDTTRMSDDSAIVTASKRAGAHDFITTLPAGYRNQLGNIYEGGAELSVGQWQRLALARALFRPSELVVLDEPTASLDARAESELFDHIVRSTEDRTVLLISHRFSTVRLAEVIYVLHDGRVVESGSHDQLMATGGRYARMFTTQAAAYNNGASRPA
jgi:ATP-binding cassette subfamily B protein